MKNDQPLKLTNILVALFMMVSVGRLHELYSPLLHFPIGKITAISALIFSIFYHRNNRQERTDNRFIIVFIIFTAVQMLSILDSVWQTKSLETITEIVLSNVVLVFLLYKTANSLKEIKFYLWALITCGVALSISTINSKVTGRLSVSTTFDPNDLALMVVSIIPLLLIIDRAKRKNKIVFITSIGVMVYTLLLTGSRGGFVALGTVVLFYYIVGLPFGNSTKKYNLLGKFKYVAIVIIIGFVFLSIAPPFVTERISSLASLQGDYNISSPYGRLALWMDGLKLMMSHPFGVGIGAFEAAQGMLLGGRYQTAHNSFVLAGAELGVIGALLFILFFYIAFKQLSSVKRDGDLIMVNLANVLQGSLIGFLVSCFFLSQTYAPILYALLVIIHKFNNLSLQKSNAG